MQVVLELRLKYPLKILLKISKLKCSTYYYHLKASKADKYAVEKHEIKKIFEANKQRYGYRGILLVLKQKGYIINHNGPKIV